MKWLDILANTLIVITALLFFFYPLAAITTGLAASQIKQWLVITELKKEINGNN